MIRATLSDLADLSAIGPRKQYRPRHRPACEPAMAAPPLLQHGCPVDTTRNDDGSRSGPLAQTFDLLAERR